MYRNLLIILLLLLGGCRKSGPETRNTTPKLIVFISIDQFRYDYPTRFARYFGKDGFNFLLERGANFVNCQYAHSSTETAVGHAVMMSGRHPGSTGIVANYWYDRQEYMRVYAAEDTSASVLGVQQKSIRDGRSPLKFKGMNLGDLLRNKTENKSKVFGVSVKDRSAIYMAGKKPNSAYWMDEIDGGFTTSSYYMNSYPQWVETFNKERNADKWLGKKWERLIPESNYPPIDTTAMVHYDYPKGWSGGLPYPIGLNFDKPDSDYYRLLLESPFSSEVLLDFVERLTVEEKLGADEFTDILCVSFSANDYIGHSFGPMSREVMDVTLRTDLYLARLFKFMDNTVGEDNILYVLTSDHGIAQIPESLMAQGIEAGRIDPVRIGELVQDAMTKKYGTLTNEKSYVGRMANHDFYFNPRALSEKKIDKKESEDYISEVLTKAVPQIFQVFTANDLEHNKIDKNKVSELVLNSYRSGISGDVIIILKPNFLWDKDTVGTEHGSPFSYDRHVPLMLAGPRWIKTGTFGKPCSPADIAPSLAAILGLDTTGFDGKILSEGIRFSK
jgi:predicted AlkP superfamily pyrophosphatase or phosphodiesterase